MTSIKVLGNRDESLKKVEFGTSFKSFDVTDAVKLSADRAESTSQLIKDLKPDDVVELIYEEGIHRWVKVNELEEEFKNHLTRGSEPDVIEIPARLPTGDTTRGAVSIALDSLRILKYDPLEMPAGKFVEWIDKQLMQKPGLYKINANLALQGPDIEKLVLSKDTPILLFIHGTFSSTNSGFGKLDPTVWSDLRKKYGERIFGYDHYTLSKSPIENALDLVKRLPQGAKLHIITHSRGGLVGELLCRAGRKNSDPFDGSDLKLAGENEKSPGPLSELSDELASRSISVERFVRVACPAGGTALASQRLDLWLEVFLNVIGRLLPPGAAQTYSIVADLLLQFKKQAANPGAMPGLASMNPESDFITMINRKDVELSVDLTVISGDIEATSTIGRLALAFADKFYRQEHDLVVNTPAMYGGPKRGDKKQRFFFDKGDKVNHFNYFSNRATAEVLRDALLLPYNRLEGGHFKPISQALEQETVSDVMGHPVQKRGGLPQPVVYLLPGIMGTHLSVKGARIWLNAISLSSGSMEKLKVGKGELAVDAEALMGAAYGNLVEFLSQTHEVIPFPYDWRRDLQDEANRFGNALEEKLKQTDQPIRIVAHSMGGLVTRAMIGLRPGVWKAITKRKGARFVMLGTPNRGAYKIPRVIFGQDKTLRMLAALDFKHSLEDLIGIIAGFPGFLQLMPLEENGPWDFLELDTWSKLRPTHKPKWPLPDAANLKKVRDFRDLLEKSNEEIDDWNPVIYVAGSAPDSPSGLEIAQKDGGKDILFQATNQGDGTVPWVSGLLPKIRADRIFYMDAGHGDMANHKKSFAAIYELLNEGTTMQLDKNPPRSSRSMEDRYILRSDVVEIHPTPADLESAVLGISPVIHRPPAVVPVKVSVVHGNLSFCESAVAVGHYEGDGLYSAEKNLDHHLDGRLGIRHKLGRYPGPEGTCEVILNHVASDDGEGIRRRPGGAIIVGLGRAGELTPRKLTASFANALREYGTKAFDHNLMKNGELKVASLLIGTGGTGLSVRNSVEALLAGVLLANKSFALLGADGYNIRISEIKFIELYKDQAVQAVRALGQMRGKGEFDIARELQTMQGGWRRIAYEEPKGWWTRITIRSAGERSSSLIFSVPADRARTEDSRLEVQRRNMDRLVAQAVKKTDWDQSLATALFELMIPNGLKGSFKDLSTVLFVVDREAARYPWELLYDIRSGDDKPLVIQAGMIRQFSTASFRENVVDVRNKSVMVVGDPANTPQRFPSLPGARQEGLSVARKFRQNGFEVAEVIQEDSSTIMSRLFSKNYRVLHLAGHGVFEFEYKASEQAEPELFTGMVLGEGVFLTASEIRKKTSIPELVFINCCHLATIAPDAKEEEKPPATAFNALAASLSEELINMGVKAVIAAGWAVDDAAALDFAEEFYEHMFKGSGFGEAVREARRVTYEKHKDRTNTWGAYQCYGDPEYRLVQQSDEDRGAKYSFVDVEEAIYKINQQAVLAKTTSAQDLRAIQNELAAIRDAIRKDHEGWLNDARLLAGLGEAFGEVLLFDESVKFYQAAVNSPRATASIKAIEQSVNLTNRLAVKLAFQNSRTAADSKKNIKKQIKTMELLIKTVGETPERQAIIGGAYKRLAQIAAGSDKKACDAALAAMEKAYRRAAVKDESPYALSNALTAALVSALRRGKPNEQKLAGLNAEVKQVIDLAEKEQEKSPDDFWAQSAVIDAILDKYLYQVLNGKPNAFIRDGYDEIRGKYEKLWKQFGSARELGSTSEHYAFLSAVLGKSKAFDQARGTLDKLQAKLKAMSQSEPDDG